MDVDHRQVFGATLVQIAAFIRRLHQVAAIDGRSSGW